MIYFISDIHGCNKTFDALLNQIAPSDTDRLILLGDYIDRGEDSKAVLDTVMAMKNATCLMGNHEQFMLLGINDPAVREMWQRNGGDKTIANFNGVYENKYLSFLNEMPLLGELGNFYFAHGSINQKDPWNSDDDTLLWDRCPSIPKTGINGKRVIVGHTPVLLDKMVFDIENSGRIRIDGGCCFKSFGYLVALRIDDMKLFVQENVED